MARQQRSATRLSAAKVTDNTHSCLEHAGRNSGRLDHHDRMRCSSMSIPPVRSYHLDRVGPFGKASTAVFMSIHAFPVLACESRPALVPASPLLPTVFHAVTVLALHTSLTHLHFLRSAATS